MEKSAGIICFRKNEHNILEFLVGHPGGPYNVRYGKWGIPKGHIENNEDSFTAAIREFEEETGINLPTHNINDYIDLGSKMQNKNKCIHIYAIQWSDFDTNNCKSNMCKIEWPPKSGTFVDIPEMDKFEWKNIEELSSIGVIGQLPFFGELRDKL